MSNFCMKTLRGTAEIISLSSLYYSYPDILNSQRFCDTNKENSLKLRIFEIFFLTLKWGSEVFSVKVAETWKWFRRLWNNLPIRILKAWLSIVLVRFFLHLNKSKSFKASFRLRTSVSTKLKYLQRLNSTSVEYTAIKVRFKNFMNYSDHW